MPVPSTPEKNTERNTTTTHGTTVTRRYAVYQQIELIEEILDPVSSKPTLLVMGSMSRNDRFPTMDAARDFISNAYEWSEHPFEELKRVA